MKRNEKLLISIVVLAMMFIFGHAAHATTWDEPWHDAVVRNADIFVHVRIASNSGSKATAEVLKLLAGNEPNKQISLENYSSLSLVSLSATEELTLPYEVGKEYFLLVKRDAKSGAYQTPTPTSGWAWIDNGKVYATYRHSYHKAVVPVETYEKTTKAIFKSSHGERSVDSRVLDFIKKALAEPPANLSSDLESEDSKRFFRQHAALETFSYIGAGADLPVLLPFIRSSYFHVQVSASRAISKIDTPESTEVLMKTIEGNNAGFAKVMCVWGLERRNARIMIPRLEAFLKAGKDEDTGFGGSIMDPRIGTRFPESVKASIQDTISRWKGLAKG